MGKEPDKVWCVVFVDGLAICPPVFRQAAAWAIMREHPGSVRRCYLTRREALRAIERGPDYPGEVAPPLF